MNFLQLCNRVKSEAGISGAELVSVKDQRGEMARVVQWTCNAYVEIQNMRDWTWLWQSLQHVLTPGKAVYDPLTDFGVPALAWKPKRFYLYDQDEGRRARRPIYCEEWGEFDAYYTDPEAQSGRPGELSVRPDRSIVFSCAPDRHYMFEGEFRLTPERLTENTDAPSMPEQYHMAIVWMAVQTYAQYEEATTLYELATMRLANYLGQMMNTELEGCFAFGGPLA